MADNNANEYSTVTLSLDDGTKCRSAANRRIAISADLAGCFLDDRGYLLLGQVRIYRQYQSRYSGNMRASR